MLFWGRPGPKGAADSGVPAGDLLKIGVSTNGHREERRVYSPGGSLKSSISWKVGSLGQELR